MAEHVPDVTTDESVVNALSEHGLTMTFVGRVEAQCAQQLVKAVRGPAHVLGQFVVTFLRTWARSLD